MTLPLKDVFAIEEIEKTRQVNNSNWMDLLRIALDARPDETRAVLRKIAEADSQIQRLLKSLGGEEV